MDLIYKAAGIGDIDLLTETRVRILRAVNHLPDAAPMDGVREHTRRYYQEALPNGSHTAYLVFDGERFAAAGGVSFYQVMPTYHNPSGRKAYIMNIYTRPEYRRRGVPCAGPAGPGLPGAGRFLHLPGGHRHGASAV